jgi:hypothetical protein
MRGKSKSRKQNVYNMKGCSKSKTRTKTSKNKRIFLGGSSNLRLAYPSKGPPSNGFNFLNPQLGGCNGQCAVVKGGAIMKGGKKSHNGICSCKSCQKGGTITKGGTNLPYPNGLLGKAWTPAISGWPGIDGISMDRNHLGYNTYDNDVSRQMRDVGANPPYTYLKGGKRRNTYKRSDKKNKNKSKSKTKTLKGGFLGQDLINVGRQVQYGIGSAYNGIRGYTSPVNPLPWKDQFK